MQDDPSRRTGTLTRRTLLGAGVATAIAGLGACAGGTHRAGAGTGPAAGAGGAGTAPATVPPTGGGPGTAAGLPTRPIPGSGEALPIVGLGTNAFGVADPAEIARREAVIARLVALGGSLIDTARAYGDSELVVAGIVQRLDVRERVFLATKTPIQGELADPAQIVAETFRRLGTDTIDLLQIHNMHGTAELMPTLQRLKAARRVRYVGVTSSRDEQYPLVLAAMREYPLDFVQVDYSIANRNAADEILPLAAERGIAVLANMPYGGRRDGNLLRRLGDRPLPAWAAEVGAASWAELLLKYVLSHPAVTCAIPGTTSVQNLETNLRAAQGPLPDAALRRRIAQDWDALRI
jgi:aryl-alcohol dehydrogenase-like predicted oxidoreductase